MALEVNVGRGTLLGMLKKDAMVELLPPLQMLKSTQQAKTSQKKKGCGRCGGNRAQATGLTDVDFDVALRQLAVYAADKPEVQRKLKEYLGAGVVRIKYKRAGNTGFVVKKF